MLQHRVGLLSWGWRVLHIFHQHPAFAKGSTGSYVVQEAEEKHPQFGVVWAVKYVPCWLVHLLGTERVPWHPGGKQGGRGRRLRRCWQGK